MAENYTVFKDDRKKEIRTVFDPDGTPYFCGLDIARLAGYEAPGRAIAGGNSGRNRIPTVKRRMEWMNSKKHGCCDYICFSAENALEFLRRKPAPPEATAWFMREVMQKAKEMGNEIAAKNLKAKQTYGEADQEMAPERPAAVSELQISFADRLDAIILECVMLKQELKRST